MKKITLSGRGTENLRNLEQRIERIKALRRRFAAALIADGLDGELLTEVMGAITEADESIASTEAVIDRHFEAHPEQDTRLLFPGLKGVEDREEHVWDRAKSFAYWWGDRGFELGVAVGMQLGPHAFDTIGPVPPRGRR